MFNHVLILIFAAWMATFGFFSALENRKSPAPQVQPRTATPTPWPGCSWRCCPWNGRPKPQPRPQHRGWRRRRGSRGSVDQWWRYPAWETNNGNVMGFHDDFMGFHGDFMGLNGDFMGFHGDFMVI